MWHPVSKVKLNNNNYNKTVDCKVTKEFKMADFNLPNEIWCMIFSYLPLAPKKNATATCKLWFMLIRGDLKLSGYIVISWLNMEEAIETLQWNWSNWPALKTLELNKLEHVTDSKDSIQNVIDRLSLDNYYPPRLEEVLFDVNLTPELQTDGHSLLKYQPKTNQIYALGQKVDSIQKWNEYERRMKVLKKLNWKGVRFAIGSNFEYLLLPERYNKYAKEFYLS